MGSDRTAAARAARALPAFVHDLGRLGLLEAEPEPAAEAPGLLKGVLRHWSLPEPAALIRHVHAPTVPQPP